MFQVAKFTALALAVSSVSAIVIPRATPPTGWTANYLEDYESYHSRYLALDCHSKHDTPFFDLCCHPLLAAESLSTRPRQCNPSSSFHSFRPTHHHDDDDDDEDCEWVDNEEEHSHIFSRAAVSDDPGTAEAPTVAATPSQGPVDNADSAPSNEKSSATVYTGGYATYYYQNGVAGACGKVHSDSDMIAAIDGDRYGNLGAVSSQCSKQVRITNSKNGKSVTVTIADACPTCTNSNSIDLSESAFKKIAPLDDGIVPITWSYV